MLMTARRTQILIRRVVAGFVLAIAIARPLAAAPAVAKLAPPPMLRERVSVLDGRVRLGDVFLNAGTAQDAVIADAPVAGRELVLPAPVLARLARGYGLAWRPTTGGEQVVIERESVVVDEAEILGLLEEGLAAKGLAADMTIELATAVAGTEVPATARLAIDNLIYTPSGRRFSTTLVVLDDGRPVQRLNLAGRVYRVVQLPVATRDVRHGELIAHDDIDWLSVRDSVVPANAILDADALVGLTPRRALRAGAPIMVNDVGRPVLVTKGALVTMVLATKAMTLTARGRALDAGGAGDTVRIANLGSHAVVAGVVTAADEVTVTGTAAPIGTATGRAGER